MSEEWRESIVDEAYQEPMPMLDREHSNGGGMKTRTPKDSHRYRNPRMAKVSAKVPKKNAPE
jgi:hypothetical protein